MNNLAHQIDEYNRTRRPPGEPVMTQKRLAGIVGTSPSLVSRHVAGQDMMLSTARRYADALRCSVDELLFHAERLPVPAMKIDRAPAA